MGFVTIHRAFDDIHRMDPTMFGNGRKQEFDVGRVSYKVNIVKFDMMEGLIVLDTRCKGMQISIQKFGIQANLERVEMGRLGNEICQS